MKLTPLAVAALVLGLGLGGFLDGIVLHQILGWHHLVCITEHCQPQSIAHLQRQNTQDGWFHLGTWGLTLAGVGLLFRAARLNPGAEWRPRVLTGGLLAGWGAFNFVEGLINHQLLGLHHVRPGHPQELLFDLLFLGSGLVLMAVGAVLMRRRTGIPAARPATAVT